MNRGRGRFGGGGGGGRGGDDGERQRETFLLLRREEIEAVLPGRFSGGRDDTRERSPGARPAPRFGTGMIMDDDRDRGGDRFAGGGGGRDGRDDRRPPRYGDDFGRDAEAAASRKRGRSAPLLDLDLAARPPKKKQIRRRLRPRKRPRPPPIRSPRRRRHSSRRPRQRPGRAAAAAATTVVARPRRPTTETLSTNHHPSGGSRRTAKPSPLALAISGQKRKLGRRRTLEKRETKNRLIMILTRVI